MSERPICPHWGWSETPFCPYWVGRNLIIKRETDGVPDPEGLARIAAELNRSYALENFAVCDWPHFLRPPLRAREPIRGRPRPRWHRHVPSMTGAVRVELEKVNPGKEIGYSKDGPIVQFLIEVIPLITGEHPDASGDAVAKELERQQKRRAGK